MIEYNRVELGKVANKYGFVRDTFEKVLRLKEILKFINVDEYLCQHLILKGGTAINLTIFNLPRLSVDIDLDFVPNCSREQMQEARNKITKILNNYMEEEHYALSDSSRYSFSLDALHYRYQNSGGNQDNIKIEINYSLRSHIFNPIKVKILPEVFDDGFEVLTLQPMEIFAAKTNALMSRAASRDLYDFNNMEEFGLFKPSDIDLFRKCVIFYNTISQESVDSSFDTSAINHITYQKIKRELFPVIKNKEKFDVEGRKQMAQKYIQSLMVLTPEEKEYMKLFSKKEYRPELLFDDEEIIKRIKNHPMVSWKMSNK
ncbi:MAG: nucleotidyl transferase AbiEii/AbiGii toxin family protein [Thomasclavelia sp.]|nr:nucleotidyl transferase AbiEii/AbiGii toxin family protein [Thomasclavelia sp.]